MRLTTSHSRRPQRLGAALAAGAMLMAGCVYVEEESMDVAAASESSPVVPTSINALMVYLTDPMAHEIWDRGYVDDPLSDHQWMLVEQYANNLAASAVLVSLGGTGQADQTWVRSPEWQRLTQEMQDGAFRAMGAVDAKDQTMLDSAGDAILASCESCHQLFKPDLPTEGIMHIPHGRPDFEG